MNTSPVSAMASLQYAWRGWILGALFAALAWARWSSHAPVVPAALILVAVGAVFRLHAGRYIPGHSNSLALAGATLALRGPYRYGRHPLYVSNLAVIGGLILFAGCLSAWGAALLFLLAALHHAALARTEEGFLSQTWGNAYGEYLRATPRWVGLPRPGPIPAKAAAFATVTRSTITKPPLTMEAATEAAAAEAPTEVAAMGGEALRASWSRQGANLGKTAACVLLLWALAAYPRA